ncbi:TrmB family transcriptional regulator [Candidatus Woesearchaeota archaeon]|nr:TrmB family transcriptional regulator [Candidatus Woesearchaeota archaeon]
MIIKEEFLKKLRSSFDLNIYEVKLWAALLSKGVATAGELSDISNVPRSRSYDVLESLEKKGFVMMKIGKPIKYLAVDPSEVVFRVKKLINDKSVNQVKMLENVRKEEVFHELQLIYKHGIEHVDHTSLAGSVKGRDNVYSQMRTMLENASKSVSIMTTSDDLLRKVDNFKKVFKKLADNGVRIRIAAPLNDKTKEALKELKGVAQVKHTDSINARFMLVDEKELMFMVANDKDIHEDYDTGIWVSTPYFSGALNSMFNQVWNNMQTK